MKFRRRVSGVIAVLIAAPIAAMLIASSIASAGVTPPFSANPNPTTVGQQTTIMGGGCTGSSTAVYQIEGSPERGPFTPDVSGNWSDVAIPLAAGSFNVTGSCSGDGSNFTYVAFVLVVNDATTTTTTTTTTVPEGTEPAPAVEGEPTFTG